MTKAEELKLLEQIDALIKSADAGDYIPTTFSGIVEVCRNNIENDFGVIPVQDMETYLEARDAEIRAHDQTKKMLNEAQKALKASEENTDYWKRSYDGAKSLMDEWERNANDAGELYCELEEECRAKSQEITKLRAEIMRMRLANMTEFDLANLYEKTEAN